MGHTKQTPSKKEFVNNYSYVSFFTEMNQFFQMVDFFVSSTTISATHDAASINN